MAGKLKHSVQNGRIKKNIPKKTIAAKIIKGMLSIIFVHKRMYEGNSR